MRGRRRAASLGARVRSVLTAWVRVDTRALAALRMALGAIVLVDVAARSTDLVAFYTDSGVVPREALAALAPTFRSISIHALWGSAWAQIALFVAAGTAALALLVGYRTKLATLISLLLLVSLHARNPAVLNGGDSLLRHLLFWGLFLPLGERWSVDAAETATPRKTVAGVATAGLLLQVVVIYATNAILKFGGENWLRGDAVEQVMLLTRHSTWAGQLLLEVPWLLTAGDYLWLAMLFCSPLLLVLTGWQRAALPTLFAGMHAGMNVVMELGIFPFVSIAALVPFLPPVVWDRLPSPPESAFRQVARNRPTLVSGDWSQRVRARLRSFTPPVAAVLVAGMLLINAASVGYVDLPDGTPAAIENKAWDMFAPFPPSDDGWYVAPATLASGRQIDALKGTNLTWDRPPDVSATFDNRRWRKLLYQLRSPPETALHEPLARYLCGRWNRAHEDDITRVRLVYVEYPTQTAGRGERIELGGFACDS